MVNVSEEQIDIIKDIVKRYRVVYAKLNVIDEELSELMQRRDSLKKTIDYIKEAEDAIIASLKSFPDEKIEISQLIKIVSPDVTIPNNPAY